MPTSHTIHLRKKRIVQYYVWAALLIFGFIVLQSFVWEADSDFHTLMEVVVTMLALMVGTMSLVRYYAQRDDSFLLIGAAFLGVALLDSYHAFVSTDIFSVWFPSPPVSLVPWSWVASRLFLAVMMFVSWIEWKRRKKTREDVARLRPKHVYITVSLFTLGTIAFFTLYPLPRAYYPELYLGRPEEWGAALFFLLALVGYIRRGDWTHSSFQHWLVLSLLISFLTQLLFIATSYHLFDIMFDTAHVLKTVSYICVLTGLFISMFHLFTRAENAKRILEDKNKSLEASQKEILHSEEALKKSKSKTEQILQLVEEEKKNTLEKMYELEQTSKAMVGRELKMKELKNTILQLEAELAQYKQYKKKLS